MNSAQPVYGDATIASMAAAVDSFFRFVLGFMLFIGVSFGVTFGVNAVAQQQTAAAQQAAALRALLNTSPASN